MFLLQVWIWFRLPVGRPQTLDPRPWFEVVGHRLRPTAAYFWDQVRTNWARPERAYVEYTNELDTLTPSMVSTILRVNAYILFAFHTYTTPNGWVIWEPYTVDRMGQLQLSSMCDVDEDMYTMSHCPLICFYAVEFHLPHRVACQFGLR